MSTLKILQPPAEYKGERLAADELQTYYYKITGKMPELIESDDNSSDMIVIGSDAINNFTHKLIMEGYIENTGLRIGTDDYLIRSLKYNERKILLLAGGRTRSVFYAIYEFLEQRADCRYFWDGDIIPEKSDIDICGLDFLDKNYLTYRGMRYFAHRSLHRFQAEHWEFDEWKKEIHYLLKKHFNLCMMRTGVEDIFQKAFPDLVNYPSTEEKAPGAIEHSYDDRTTFWSLKYRGELREKIFSYLSLCDLIQPEDVGPITHWYSRTPKDFLDKVNPKLFKQDTKVYSEESGLVWDFRKQDNFENYYKLTKASIKNGGRPDMFHMIGLAERSYGDKKNSMNLKIYAYRKFIDRIRNEYPNAPLLLASWDFMYTWTAGEVAKLLEELDPTNTIILDYTTDSHFENNNYRSWGLPGKFPWIFGVFQGLEPQNALFFDFKRTETQIKEIANDPCCCGMVIWSENSHANSFLFDFIAENSRHPGLKKLEQILADFCRNRYGIHAETMEKIWLLAIPLLKHRAWGHNKDERKVGDFYPSDIEASIFKNGSEQECILAWEKKKKENTLFTDTFNEISNYCNNLEQALDHPFIRRDIIDMFRSFIFLDMDQCWSILQLELLNWNAQRGNVDKIIVYLQELKTKFFLMEELLEQSEDFSLYESFVRLSKHRKINPLSEDVLKGNAENLYCRTYIYELYKAIYIPEFEIYSSCVQKKLESNNHGEKITKEDMQKAIEKNKQIFYETPLEKFAPRKARSAISLNKIIELFFKQKTLC